MFDFTRQEKGVVLFLSFVALAGFGLSLAAKSCSQARAAISFFQDTAKIDLNSADRELLEIIPGIGQKLTQRILEYRDKEGGFKKLEDLKNIKGITNHKFEQIKKHLILKP